MTKNLKDDIKKAIESIGWVTYPQLLRYLSKKGYKVEGDAGIMDDDTATLFWYGIDEDLVMALSELLNDQVIGHFPAAPELYLHEGFTFPLPLSLNLEQDRTKDSEPVLFLSILALRNPEKEMENKVNESQLLQ